MKNLLFLGAVIFILIPSITFAKEVTCSSDLINQYSCNQCFQEGSIYEGNTDAKMLWDTVYNNGTAINRYYSADITEPWTRNTFGTNIVTFKAPAWQYSTPFFTNCSGGWCSTPSGRQFTFLNPGNNFRWIETKPGFHLQATNVDISKITDANRANIRDRNFTIVYSLKAEYRNSPSQTTVLGTNTHIECQSVGVHFCGDGYTEPGKETCDDGGQNGQPGKCNTSCNGTVPPTPTPSCDGIGADPTFGTTPLTTTLTCNGSNLPAGSTYAITCGDGSSATMNGNRGTCTYTSTTTASITREAQCTINSTITSNACKTNIVVNPAPTFDLSIKKYVDDTSKDAQTVGTAVDKTPGDTFDYKVIVKNEGTITTTGRTTVKDILPSGVVSTGAPTGTGWSCTVSGQTVTCISTQAIASGAVFPTITVPVKVTATSGTLTNHAVVHNPDEDPTKVCKANNTMPAGNESSCTDPRNTDPAVIKVGSQDTTFDLSIKKFVGDNDAQTESSAAQIEKNSDFIYKIQVKNEGTGSTTGKTTVIDTLPIGVSLSGTTVDSDSGWTCTGTTTNAFKCESIRVVAPGAYFPIITVKAKTLSTLGTVTNHAFVQNPDEVDGKQCKADGSMPSGSETACSEDPRNEDPAVIKIIEPTTGFDLSIKKYAKSEDVFAVIDNNEDFNYTIVVQNNGSTDTSGVTTVKDILPEYITLRALPSGNGWDCSGSAAAGGKNITCTTSAVIAPHQVFPVITIPVRSTAAVFQPAGIVNRAFVHNPNEKIGSQCFSDGHMPAGNESQCIEDLNNSDPASVNPPNPTGFDLRLKKYVNGDDESSGMPTGGTAIYTFTVENLGALASSGTTTVTDTFPTGVTPSTPTGVGWSCSLSGQSFTCTRSDVLAVGAFYPVITVSATVVNTTGVYKNVACLSNPQDPNQNAVRDFPNNQYKVNNCDPAEVVVVPAGTFDLTILKKVGKSITDGTLQDRNTADENNIDPNQNILIINQSGSLVYTFGVKNLGSVTATGTTTVEDTLPNDITIVGTPTGTGWSCSVTGNGNRSFQCTRSDTLAVGSSYPDIIVSAQASSTIPAGEYSNTATLKNPNDTNPANNTDPANVKVKLPTGPSCGPLSTPTASPVAPSSAVTYTCAATGYTGVTADLEYNIRCSSTDTGSWSTGATRVCTAPAGYSTSTDITCAVRNKNTPTVTFSGSEMAACKTALTTTSGGGGGGGTTYYVPTCVNGIATCASQVHNSTQACQSYNGVSTCYTEQAACNTAKNSLVCSGPGGGGGNGSGGGGGSSAPACGNGIVQPLGNDGIKGTSDDEQCDLGSRNAVPDSKGKTPYGCTNTCKLTLGTTTNPGENPILDLWIKIPTLSHARLGLSGLDGMKKSFKENELVIGKNNPVFSIADQIMFGIDTKYDIPLLVPASHKVCIYSDNVSSISQPTAGSPGEFCKSFGDLAGAFKQTINGSEYVVIGKGNYIACQTMTSTGCTQYAEYKANPSLSADDASEVPLFGGNKLLNGLTLRDSFSGNAGTGNIRLTIARPELVKNDRPIDLAMPVRVSKALGSATNTVAYISPLSTFQTTNILDHFLGGLSRDMIVGAAHVSTPPVGSTASTATTPAARPFVITPSTVGDRTVSSLSDLLALRTNGNDKLLTLSGNLVIENCTASTLQLMGVRTIYVRGNITIKCNLIYPGGDTTSSWAIISDGGDISVGTDVSSLAGVIVSTTGAIRSVNNQTTNTILRVDGQFSGNSQPIYDAHISVRGTSAHEILTAGVILMRSSRADTNTPPLLRKDANGYSIQSVAR